MSDQEIRAAFEDLVREAHPPRLPESTLSRVAFRRATAAFLVILSITIISAAVVVGGRTIFRSSDPVGPASGSSYETVTIRGDIEGEARIPPGWSYVADAPGEHAVLGLAASPDSAVVQGLVEGKPESDSHSFRPVDLSALAPDGAFVDVVIAYILTAEQQHPQLPRILDPDSFATSDSVFGEPVRELVAEGRDRGIYRIRYWVGPDATNEVGDETHTLIRTMRLPGF